jgi:hypothetical protein
MSADATTAQGASNGQNGADNNQGPSNGALSQDIQTNGAAGTSGLNVQMVRPRVAQMELTEIKVRALVYRYIRILEQFLTVSPTHIPKIKPVIWINLFLLC